MTKIANKIVKCAVCGNESEQLFVYSINYLLGSKEDNDNLRNSKQKCPSCGYEAKNISILDYSSIENKSELKEILDIKNKVIKLFNIEVDNLKCKKIDEELYYFYENIKGGRSIIISKNGEYLGATSLISFDKHLEEFKKGDRNKRID